MVLAAGVAFCMPSALIRAMVSVPPMSEAKMAKRGIKIPWPDQISIRIKNGFRMLPLKWESACSISFFYMIDFGWDLIPMFRTSIHRPPISPQMPMVAKPSSEAASARTGPQSG